MHMNEMCASCMISKQEALSDNREYLDTIRKILDDHIREDSSPYMALRFSQAYEKFFGPAESYAPIRKQYNDLVLSMEDAIRTNIEASEDPLFSALIYSRTGNYIDFAAMDHVEPETLIRLLEETKADAHDHKTYASFLSQCENAESFLLLADNCGEIVLDRLMLEQLHKRFPKLKLTVMVRGGEVVNDAVMEDAEYAGIPSLARVITCGSATGGVVPALMSAEAKAAMDEADVILAKGQGNYEGLYGEGWHIFYLLLCKCEMFAQRFNVPRMTGMFTEAFK